MTPGAMTGSAVAHVEQKVEHPAPFESLGLSQHPLRACQAFDTDDVDVAADLNSAFCAMLAVTPGAILKDCA